MMTRSFFSILGIAGSLMIAACSSSSDVPDQPSQANANTASVAVNSTTQNPNSTLVNGMTIQPQPGDANSAAAAATDSGAQLPAQADLLKSKMERLKNSGESETVDPLAMAMKNAKPAPDNSLFASYLAEAGYEIRIFKSHPHIQKVVKRTESNGSSTVSIFLRSGKVVQARGSSIPVLSTAPVDSIAAVAGLSQPPAPAKDAPAASTGAKKGDN